MSIVMKDMKDLTDSREMLEAKTHPAIASFIYILIVLLIGALVWSYFGEMDTVVKGSGVVRPNNKVSSIKSVVTGRIETVHYKAGQKVKQGDLLFTLEGKEIDALEQSLEKEMSKVQEELQGLREFKSQLTEDGLGLKAALTPESAGGSGRVIQQQLLLEQGRIRTELHRANEELQNLSLLGQSIAQGQNLFSSVDSEYYTKYQDYETRKRKLQNAYEKSQDAHVLITQTGVEEDIATSRKQMEDAKLSLDTHINEYMLSLQTGKEELKKKLQTLELDKGKMLLLMNQSIAEQEAAQKKLEDQIQKNTFVATDRKVSAPVGGTVNVLRDINQGDLLEAGAEVLTIVPDNNTEFTMQVTLQNKDIASLQIGDRVEYHFVAMPYKEYGKLGGTVETIGADAIMHPQNASSFYVMESTIENKTLINNKGKVAEIKAGMTAEAYVITGSKSILDFLLEKIDLKE